MGVIITFCTFLLIERFIVGRDILTCCWTELPPEVDPFWLPAGLAFEEVVPVFSELARPLVPGICCPALAVLAG